MWNDITRHDTQNVAKFNCLITIITSVDSQSWFLSRSVASASWHDMVFLCSSDWVFVYCSVCLWKSPTGNFWRLFGCNSITFCSLMFTFNGLPLACFTTFTVFFAKKIKRYHSCASARKVTECYISPISPEPTRPLPMGQICTKSVIGVHLADVINCN